MPSGLLSAARSLLARRGCIVIQTLHPHTRDGPSRDGRRTGDFSAFENPDWQPMPWCFRTLESWHAAIRDAGLVLADLSEQVADGGEKPLSLVLTCEDG